MSRIASESVGSKRLAGWQSLIDLLEPIPQSQRAEAWANLWAALGDAETRSMLAETLGQGWRWPPAAVRSAGTAPEVPTPHPKDLP